MYTNDGIFVCVRTPRRGHCAPETAPEKHFHRFLTPRETFKLPVVGQEVCKKPTFRGSGEKNPVGANLVRAKVSGFGRCI